MGLRHRSGLKKGLFFVTTTIVDFFPVFRNQRYYRILADCLNFLRHKGGLSVFAYVFMPNHIHLIVGLPNGGMLSREIGKFKSYTSHQIRQLVQEEGWEEALNVFRKAGAKYPGQQFKIWMERFDDVSIYTRNVFETKVRYIHENPVRKGIISAPVAWPYSSAAYYAGKGDSLVGIDDL